MSAPTPYEQSLLHESLRCLRAQVAHFPRQDEARLDVLEALASLLGGFPLDGFWALTSRRHHLSVEDALAMAEVLHKELLSVDEIHPSLALASLSQRDMQFMDRRTSGAYYTDFRLATHLADLIVARLDDSSKVLDPSSGTGILLVACALALAEKDRAAVPSLIANGLYAGDLSEHALRGVVLALASLTDDLAVVKSLLGHVRSMDSLLEGVDGWNDLAPEGFNYVVGNPPWEKLKLSRHEFLVGNGQTRHYGADYSNPSADFEGFHDRQRQLREYVSGLNGSYRLQGSGEPDVFKLFLELSVGLSKPGGDVALLLPAGLIRSKGCTELRRHLISNASSVSVTVLDNRSRFFAIDTRFKFVSLHIQVDPGKACRVVSIAHGNGHPWGVSVTKQTRLNTSDLQSVRPDLSVPEVRTAAEWDLFKRMMASGVPLGDRRLGWNPRIVREVDMTRDRSLFLSENECDSALPLIEGRMVHQFAFGAKAYVSGTGRRATWRPTFGERQLSPQYWISPDALRPDIRERASQERVGFCDITGQTNERTVLASHIPANVVCGNKVPTITFTSDTWSSDDLNYLWLAIANSFVFDWFVRRIVTTTLNFFLLLSAPVPRLTPKDDVAQDLSRLARELTSDTNPNPWTTAERRARMDALVAAAFGFSMQDLEVVLADFPLLDRVQPPITSEKRSTVTADLVRHETAQWLGAGKEVSAAQDRVLAARDLGAVPYVPTEFARVEARTKRGRSVVQ